jgi:hypothetical protein
MQKSVKVSLVVLSVIGFVLLLWQWVSKPAAGGSTKGGEAGAVDSDGGQIDPLASHSPGVRAPVLDELEDISSSRTDDVAGAWLRLIPNRALVGSVGDGPWAEFWGPEWPTMLDYFRKTMGQGVDGFLKIEVPADAPPSELGDVSEFMKQLGPTIAAKIASQGDITSDFLASQGTLIAGLGQLRDGAPGVLERAIDLAASQRGLDADSDAVKDVRSLALLRMEERLARAIDELMLASDAFADYAVTLVVSDASSIDAFNMPKLGKVLVNPAFCTLHPDHFVPGQVGLGGNMAMVSLSSSDMDLPGCWCATYSLDISADPAGGAMYEDIASMKASLVEWVTAELATYF